MIIKKFQAETETEAMELAKKDLGKDAIVTNIKTIKPKGIYKLFKKSQVEITAAIDEHTVSKAAVGNPGVSAAYPAFEEKRSYPLPDTSAEESAIEKKLNDLQELLEKQMANAANTAALQGQTGAAQTGEGAGLRGEEPEENSLQETEQHAANIKHSAANKRVACIQLIYNQLLENEVDEKYTNQIISEIEGALKRDASVDNILGAVYQKIILKLGHPETLELEEGKTKYVFFIGPTGVGKTTTIAKIASSFKLGKKAKVALLTADTYRIAAVEQLRTYAGILDIPLKVVYSAEELTETKKEFHGFDLVLVDTAGRSHKSQEQGEELRRLLSAIPVEERETYLVLSATTKYQDLVKITEVYQEISDFKLIFTKLDETSSVGNVFNIRMLTEAPLSYNTWGQNVPDDIGKIDAQKIAKQLLGGG